MTENTENTNVEKRTHVLLDKFIPTMLEISERYSNTVTFLLATLLFLLIGATMFWKAVTLTHYTATGILAVFMFFPLMACLLASLVFFFMGAISLLATTLAFSEEFNNDEETKKKLIEWKKKLQEYLEKKWRHKMTKEARRRLGPTVLSGAIYLILGITYVSIGPNVEAGKFFLGTIPYATIAISILTLTLAAMIATMTFFAIYLFKKD